MPGAGGDQPSLTGIDVNQLGGDEHVYFRELIKEQSVHSREQFRGLMGQFRQCPQQAAQRGGEHRRRNPLAHDVGNDHEQRVIGELDDIVKIPADLAGALAVSGQPESRQLRQRLDEQIALNVFGDLQVAGH